MRMVLDTNVLISALAFPGSKPDQILSRIRRGETELFISPFILSELDRVLREKFRFTNKEVGVRVNAIRAIAHVITPTERITVVTANDDDNRILECAALLHFVQNDIRRAQSDSRRIQDDKSLKCHSERSEESLFLSRIGSQLSN